MSDRASTKTPQDVPIEPIDALQLLRTIEIHCRYVRTGLRTVANELTERGERHDDSKLFHDEFGGFSRINRIAREHPYGSAEYREALRSEKFTTDWHYTRNRHHPEYHEKHHSAGSPVKAGTMTFIDIIEMVCDWRGAWLGYGAQKTWSENIAYQKTRYPVGEWFTAHQWWLIDQVAQFVEQIERVYK